MAAFAEREAIMGSIQCSCCGHNLLYAEKHLSCQALFYARLRKIETTLSAEVSAPIPLSILAATETRSRSCVMQYRSYMHWVRCPTQAIASFRLTARSSRRRTTVRRKSWKCRWGRPAAVVARFHTMCQVLARIEQPRRVKTRPFVFDCARAVSIALSPKSRSGMVRPSPFLERAGSNRTRWRSRSISWRVRARISFLRHPE